MRFSSGRRRFQRAPSQTSHRRQAFLESADLLQAGAFFCRVLLRLAVLLPGTSQCTSGTQRRPASVFLTASAQPRTRGV